MSSEASTLLAGAGLVDQDGDFFALRPERFREALESLGRPEGPAVPNSGLGADADRILRIFVRNGRLVQIPAVQASAEGERVPLHVDLHGAAFAEGPFQQGHRQTVAELLLDHPLERPGAEVGVVAPPRQPQLRFR